MKRLFERRLNPTTHSNISPSVEPQNLIHHASRPDTDRRPETSCDTPRSLSSPSARRPHSSSRRVAPHRNFLLLQHPTCPCVLGLCSSLQPIANAAHHNKNEVCPYTLLAFNYYCRGHLPRIRLLKMVDGEANSPTWKFTQSVYPSPTVACQICCCMLAKSRSSPRYASS